VARGEAVRELQALLTVSRIRTIKPDFWTDEKVGECSPSARLLFVAMWNFADDHGSLDRSAKQLKAQAFPYDNLDAEPLLQELLTAGLVIEYHVADKCYLHIKGFREHQRIDKPSNPKVPVYEDSFKSRRTLTESSASPRPSSLGREGKGMEGSKTVSAAAPPTRSVVSREATPDWMLDFKLSYPERAGDQNWRGALRAANARLAEGHSTADLIAGARRYAAFVEATGKARTEYVQQAARFLGPSKPFLLPWTPPAKPETAMERIQRLNGGDHRTLEHEPDEPLAIAR